ncbi:hypothetical protein [Amycolatopsis sp. PS_44_ISF1]|uniref:hypothetical protein n=1 Tax=Amycolatopsis sp. PS_44_ISF1 TaxID=2974917 RepID=UPI0028E0151A|nr:hypothetical protein [Amycolatopsis sp. PS_44_ISF1]MDT8915568.1 hypothetical protein [Amycolatopsis sp. PS_44_ISF1]
MDVASPALPPVAAGRGGRGRVAARGAVHAGWVAALALATEWRVGRFGFQPTDQGFILAQAWRVRHGEVPHAGIISARPLGSAVLHVLDFALPGPLFFASGVLAMVELTLATMAFAVLVTRRPVHTWGVGRTALVAAAALVNLNGFPLMAWHTIDGIALTACGAWALDAGLRSGKALPRLGGLALLGAAVFMKQSFVPAALIGLVWTLSYPDRRRRLIPDVLALGAFGLGYVAWVTAGGGFGAMVAQLTGGVPAYGERLLGLWLDDPATLALPPGRRLTWFAAIAVVLVLVRLGGDRLGAAGRVVSWLSALGAVAVVVWTIWDGRFTASTRWADVLWWILGLAVVVRAIGLRRLPWAGLLVLATGFMASLSWGNDTPTLLTGTLALTALLLVAEVVPPAEPLPRLTATAGLATAALCGWAVVAHHDEAAYFDLSHGELTADLGAVSPALQGIRTNPATYAYVAQIHDCLNRYPAEQVAVLPDNPFAYPAFGRRNPFPLEWPLPQEIVGDAPARMLTTADRLDHDGDYLVLFETVPNQVLAHGGPVPASVPAATPNVDYQGLENAIRARLAGESVVCGSFVGKWQPRR